MSKPAPNNWKPWTEDEIHQVLTTVGDWDAMLEVAKSLGRSFVACQHIVLALRELVRHGKIRHIKNAKLNNMLTELLNLPRYDELREEVRKSMRRSRKKEKATDFQTEFSKFVARLHSQGIKGEEFRKKTAAWERRWWRGKKGSASQKTL